MKKLSFILILCLLVSFAQAEGSEVMLGTLYVRKVENLDSDFVLGMDASCVIAQEKSGVIYRDYDGTPRDVFEVLSESGITHIRVRVWNDPYDSEGHGFGGGNCDIDNAVAIGKRATKAGMKLIVDFHYSDFWADPSKQMVPRAWKGMDIETKTQAVYEYTRDCLMKLRDAGVEVGIVQVGNETNGAMCGEKIWFNIQYLMQAGAKASREVYPEALVALHFTNPEKAGNLENFAKKMDYYKVDYDIFASSYYPYWHGSLENLASVLSSISRTYGKKVMVMETSYAYTSEDTDFNGNTIGEGSVVTKTYPYTVQGQAQAVIDIIDTIANQTEGGMGVVYWEGTWNSVGTESWEKNSALWETYGSGWATKYAWVYDPNDAGKYYGGNAVDNQAMFDAQGMPLESLKLFKLVRTGNPVPLAPDAIEDVNLTVDLNGEIKLPETVNAVMNDGSKQALPVTWNFTESDDRMMHEGGVNKYTVTGTAQGMEARCYISMVEYNFVSDYSFEEGGRDWVLNDIAHADELYFEDKVSDSLTGSKHLHFWSAKKNSVEFTAEQEISNLPAGAYKLSVSVMGGDAGTTDIYCYIKIDGEIVATAPMKITSYNNWDTGVIERVNFEEGHTLTVGVYVKCEGSGSGAWGKIDDVLLNSVK